MTTQPSYLPQDLDRYLACIPPFQIKKGNRDDSMSVGLGGVAVPSGTPVESGDAVALGTRVNLGTVVAIGNLVGLQGTIIKASI